VIGSPDGLQHLLSRAKWDADAVRDDLRFYVSEHFADPAGILVVDETGDVKKGQQTVGTLRQYTGAAGRIENAQVAVYLTYAAPRGHALIDRALYLPKCWTDDPGRLQRAGVPPEVEFATKPALAQQMITAALDAGVPARFVAGDEVYGNDSKLRNSLQQRGVGFVLAVSCSHRVPTAAGPLRADLLAAGLPRRSWQRLSAGAGTKGHRFYSWAYLRIDDGTPGHHWLWCAATILPVSWRTTAAIPRGQCRWRCWSESLVNGGRSRSPSKPRKAKPDSTNTRSDAGVPGTAGAPWRCSRWHSWPSPQPTNETGTPHPPNSCRSASTSYADSSTPSSSVPPPPSLTSCAGPSGVENTKPEPNNAPITAGHSTSDPIYGCSTSRRCHASVALDTTALRSPQSSARLHSYTAAKSNGGLLVADGPDFSFSRISSPRSATSFASNAAACWLPAAGHWFAALAAEASHPDVTLHRLRHSVATNLVSRGDFLRAQYGLGHADEK